MRVFSSLGGEIVSRGKTKMASLETKGGCNQGADSTMNISHIEYNINQRIQNKD